jgi:hypothetical protein
LKKNFRQPGIKRRIFESRAPQREGSAEMKTARL